MPEEGRKGSAIVTVDAALAKATALFDAVSACAHDTSFLNAVAAGMSPEETADILDNIAEANAAMRETVIADTAAWLIETMRAVREEA